MKVANITLHAINNYGSVLQTLATEHLFEQLGCEVETIDYVRETAQLNSVFNILRYGGPGWLIKCKQLFLHLFHRHDKRVDTLNEFRKRCLHLGNRKYRSDIELECNPPVADVYCTGSDQTWNTVVQGGVPKAFFLHFVPDGKKRIAFSASFGIDKLPNKDKNVVKSLLSHYSHISVREKTGLDILKDLGFNDAIQVLDPTLAVDSAFWDLMASSRIVKEDYIFVYQLNTSTSFTKYVNNFSTAKRMPVLYVKARENKGLKNSRYMECPKPEELLSLFKFSSYVITDSFHATAFSIIFHCNFIDIYPEKFPSRLDSVLKLTNLESRHLVDMSDYTITNKAIDYEHVDSIINKERLKTMTFLKNAITQ